MGLKLNRGGRVAAATVFATLLLSLAFASAFKLGSRAQPAHAPCSCAACASAPPGAAPKTVSVEWLDGSERASAVEKALSLEEFERVSSVLGRLGYRPAPEKALAVKFEREVRGRLAKHLLVAVPFEGGGSERYAFALALLEPSAEALAFEIDLKARVMKLVAREPASRPSLILPQAKGAAQRQTAVGVNDPGCTSPRPDCGYCRIALCVCTEWNIDCLLSCASYICGFGCIVHYLAGGPGALIACLLVECTYCLIQCCIRDGWVCYDCYPYHCYEWTECCDTCPSCWSDPNCPCYPNCGQQ